MMFGRDPKGPLSLLIGERTEEARLTTNLACTNSKTQKNGKIDNVQLGATNTDRLKPYFEPIISNRNKTATENDQTINERQRITTNNNDGSMDDDLNLQNIKENNPPTCYAPSQRRV
ncbi:unnamed protein product [Rotaria magnacalcarata]|uniref:Uncharacterized protein n=1 Tax=Rotaria magnacalcarata TaxID=392030 RepID=A0A820GBP4_9BILA|nr:unnamed protein product [Rotaria magnacalcarata]CAF4277453.1 unnamed protein product [Rotaria magnacalcarata]